jgi:hypothetical protein
VTHISIEIIDDKTIIELFRVIIRIKLEDKYCTHYLIIIIICNAMIKKGMHNKLYLRSCK